MFNVQVKIKGDKEVLAKLTQLGSELSNYAPTMKTIGTELKGFYGGQVFASQGGILGKSWAPLSEKYKIYKATGHSILDNTRWRPNPKAHTYPGAGPNIASGHMQKSFDYKSDANSVYVYNKVSDEDDPYFNYIQLGTTRMPARPMISGSDAVRSIVQSIVDRDTTAKLRKAGF